MNNRGFEYEIILILIVAIIAILFGVFVLDINERIVIVSVLIAMVLMIGFMYGVEKLFEDGTD